MVQYDILGCLVTSTGECRVSLCILLVEHLLVFLELKTEQIVSDVILNQGQNSQQSSFKHLNIYPVKTQNCEND